MVVSSLFLRCLFFVVLLVGFGNAEVRLSHLFVLISDSMEEVKKENFSESLPILEQFKSEFELTQNNNSPKGAEVKKALESALKNPKIQNLESLSTALIAFEKEQNPIDYEAKRKQFEKRVMPLYKLFKEETSAKNAEEIQALYKRLYDTWQRNERIVGDTSPGHYGQIEIALTLYRVAMVSEPMNFEVMELQSSRLGAALEEFISGKVLEAQSATNAPQTLSAGLNLLRGALEDFPNNASKAKDAIFVFITQWPIFEGEVRTRDGKLYNRIESELPEIVARSGNAENLAQLRNLIESIEALDINANYTAIDSAIILLREGVEALLIVMALLAALEAAKQNRGYKWVIGGAVIGIGLSFVAAFLLAILFPLAAAGTNREILEGGVGILAVIVMLFVGAWLHSKSSLRGWQDYIAKQMGKALASGSLIGLAGLSFLAVFREGAETILFYAGLLPKITMTSFLSGIGIAVVGLVIIAYLMRVFTQKLPIHLMFMAMSWLIYCIGFKMLGVSIHALQLTNILPMQILPLPSFAFIGFYNNIQGITTQAVYVLCVIAIVLWQRNAERRLER